MKVLTFGEIMLRLKAPGHERFFQSPSLEATFGGGEANVAVSLANYGMDAAFLTVLPKTTLPRRASASCAISAWTRPASCAARPHGHLLSRGRREPAAEQSRL